MKSKKMKYCIVILLKLAHEEILQIADTKHHHSNDIKLHISLTSPRIWLVYNRQGHQTTTNPLVLDRCIRCIAKQVELLNHAAYVSALITFFLGLLRSFWLLYLTKLNPLH